MQSPTFLVLTINVRNQIRLTLLSARSAIMLFTVFPKVT